MDFQFRRENNQRLPGDASSWSGDVKHLLTTDPVAEVPEDDAGERACHEANGERQESQNRSDHRIKFRKKQLVKYESSSGAIQEVVIETVPIGRSPVCNSLSYS
jgi:hypothetical protein